MRPSLEGLAAAALSGVVAVLYLGLIVSGDVRTSGGGWVAVGTFALLFVALPLCAAVASFRHGTTLGIGLMAFAATGLLVTGFLAILSIGMPLVVASVLAWVALFRSVRRRGRLRAAA